MDKPSSQNLSQAGLSRRIEMRTPEAVSAMPALRARGWRFMSPVSRSKSPGGLEDWLPDRFRQHAGNADVVYQALLAEKGISVSLRTVERAKRSLKYLIPLFFRCLRVVNFLLWREICKDFSRKIFASCSPFRNPDSNSRGSHRRTCRPGVSAF